MLLTVIVEREPLLLCATRRQLVGVRVSQRVHHHACMGVCRPGVQGFQAKQAQLLDGTDYGNVPRCLTDGQYLQCKGSESSGTRWEFMKNL